MAHRGGPRERGPRRARRGAVRDAGDRQEVRWQRAALADDGADPWRDEGDGHGALRALPSEIAGQARQIRRFGSPEQVEQAAVLLEDVKRQLYGILAAGPGPEATEG